ncbi:kinase [Colletotrichum higginsianum]|nr:kinase [Colletotrichum higginsianum]
MARLLGTNAILTGRLSSYTIVKELHEAVDRAAVYLARRIPVATIDQHLPSRQIEHRNQSSDKFVIKSIRGHWRLRNEANVLRRYQSRTPFLRPLVDEIQESADPSSIVLRYLDSDMLAESNKKRLSRPEIKQVARCVLEALQVLHDDGMVHTDMKLDNIFVNHGQGDRRFSDIQLGDCGGVVSQHSTFAREGHLIGAGLTRSPEAMFQLPSADKDFLLKIMKLDPRDRPSAEDLLADDWFTEDSQDTRDPLPGEAKQPEKEEQCGNVGSGWALEINLINTKCWNTDRIIDRKVETSAWLG